MKTPWELIFKIIEIFNLNNIKETDEREKKVLANMWQLIFKTIYICEKEYWKGVNNTT